MALARIEEVMEELRRGRMVILVDDEDRENEGDLCMAAEMATLKRWPAGESSSNRRLDQKRRPQPPFYPLCCHVPNRLASPGRSAQCVNGEDRVILAVRKSSCPLREPSRIDWI